MEKEETFARCKVEKDSVRPRKRCWKEQIKVWKEFNRVRRYGLPFSPRCTLSEKQKIARG